MLFPPSKKFVIKNFTVEVDILQKSGANILLLQETTTRSIMNFDTRMMDVLKASFGGYDTVFSPSVKISFPFRMEHGNSLISEYALDSAKRYSLPLENRGLTSILKQRYNFILGRYKIEGSDQQWIVIDLHFSAFDKNGETRKKQLHYIERVIFDEYAKGNYVVVGGDWNLRLANTSFPYDTDPKYLFWVEDLGEATRKELIDAGWYFAIDMKIPTVRTDERPYDGKNYTTIIDDLCSPNVELLSIAGINAGFEGSDHNPVKISVKGR